MLEHRVGQAQLERTANLGLGRFGTAVAVGGEQVEAGAAFAAVEPHAGQRMCIHTDADGALGEARLEQQAQAEAGFLAVAVAARRVAVCGRVGAVLVFAVHVERTAEQLQGAVIDESLGFGLLTCHGDGGCYGGNGQREGAPLNRVHVLLLVFLGE